MTFIDSNVILDLLTRDPHWLEWSRGQVDAARTRGRISINEIVYAEISVRFASMKSLDDALDRIE